MKTLTAEGVTMSYQTLMAFCRRQGIGRAPVVPAGSYDHECLPGVEMQHDTSPHEVTVAALPLKNAGDCGPHGQRLSK